MNEDWRLQTLPTKPGLNPEFEPIIEIPHAEYDTGSGKKRKKTKKSTAKISERLHYQSVGNFKKDRTLSGLKITIDDEDYISSEQPPMKLMSSRSRKILDSKLKKSIIGQLEGGDKISKMLNTPVHERLFEDYKDRKLRKIAISKDSKRFSSKTPGVGKPPIGALSSYRSVGNLRVPDHPSKIKVSDNLRITFSSLSPQKVVKETSGKLKRSTSSMMISSEISNKLYQDACRRQSQKFENESAKNKNAKSILIQKNEVSQRYLFTRFKDDFRKSIHMQGISSQVLDRYTAEEVIKDMGYLSRSGDQSRHHEKILFFELWKTLKGDKNNGVQVQDLQAFLGAVEGFELENRNEICSDTTHTASIFPTSTNKTMNALNFS